MAGIASVEKGHMRVSQPLPGRRGDSRTEAVLVRRRTDDTRFGIVVLRIASTRQAIQDLIHETRRRLIVAWVELVEKERQEAIGFVALRNQEPVQLLMWMA